MFEIRTRSAKDPDMPQVRAINTHYILHTELPFAQFPPPPETYPARLAALSARGLPYSVAMTEVQTVSDIICKQILIQTSGQIILPSSQSAASVVYAMPTLMQERIRTFASGSLPRMHNVQPYEK
ncbi:uncharacterized protein N7469_002447 [Penicillium citrinum]|uniref:Uncharacterized protein n=1 Tax=Penicillium citrinum TaxID=5077 RepID=A0A9W9PAC3_PENCI|nr:uncharacterized protein N7469_002447 [Penicillium citrinum]KAJ5240856.1 hypothetical protein N7469_002447 [Penicillium citrinum]